MLSDHDKIMDRFERDLKKVAQRSCALSALGVVTRSRKLSGQYRMSTRLGVGRLDMSVTLAGTCRPNFFTNEIGTQERNFAASSQRINLGDRVFISNSLPYGPELEFQRGDLMFTRSASNWGNDVSQAVREVRNAF